MTIALLQFLKTAFVWTRKKITLIGYSFCKNCSAPARQFSFFFFLLDQLRKNHVLTGGKN
jgi:hypothetical protein